MSSTPPYDIHEIMKERLKGVALSFSRIGADVSDLCPNGRFMGTPRGFENSTLKHLSTKFKKNTPYESKHDTVKVPNR